jgi:hypothetical protein
MKKARWRVLDCSERCATLYLKRSKWWQMISTTSSRETTPSSPSSMKRSVWWVSISLRYYFSSVAHTSFSTTCRQRQGFPRKSITWWVCPWLGIDLALSRIYRWGSLELLPSDILRSMLVTKAAAPLILNKQRCNKKPNVSFLPSTELGPRLALSMTRSLWVLSISFMCWPPSSM